MRTVCSSGWRLFAAACCLIALLATAVRAQGPELKPRAGAEAAQALPGEDETVLPAPKLPPPEKAVKLPDPDLVWVDAKQHLVYVDGYISLREGLLEMFACKEGTKEHESIVALRARAATIHAALLAIGAKDGDPVQFTPKFKPPTGTEIEIEVQWVDERGHWQKARAQEWVIDAKTDKPMEQPWVFAGSSFWRDEQSGKDIYTAEAGDVICVSNFTTAMLDIPIESSQSNEGLLFEANAEKIPPLGLPVRLALKPKLEAKKAKGAGPASAPPASTATPADAASGDVKAAPTK